MYPSEANINSGDRIFTRGELFGMTGFYGNTSCLWVLSGRFREILKQYKKLCSRTACKRMEQKGYLARFSDRFYKELRELEGSPSAYCVLFPAAKTLTETITDIPMKNRSVNTIVRKITHDPFGNYSVKQSVPPPLKLFGFVRLSAQHTRLVFNTELVRALKLTLAEKLYILPIPSCNKLMLSKEKLSNDSLCISLEGHNRVYWYDGIVTINLLHMFSKEVPLYSRLVFGDISIDKGATPIATIDLSNDHHTWIGDMNKTDYSIIDDVDKLTTVAFKQLLTDDPDEE